MKKTHNDEEKSFLNKIFSPFKKLRAKVGDLCYAAAVAIHAKTAKPTKKNVTPGARRIKESIFYYGMLVLPLIQFLVF